MYCNQNKINNFCKKFKLSDQERYFIENEKLHYKDPLAASIESLKIVQKKRGWVSDDAIYAIAELLGISAIEVEGVATFYSQIFRQPVGKHVIRYCDSIVCYITGYIDIVKELESILKINPGQTTADNRFTLLPTCCLGNCDKAPTIMINNDTHHNVSPTSINTLLKEYQ